MKTFVSIAIMMNLILPYKSNSGIYDAYKAFIQSAKSQNITNQIKLLHPGVFKVYSKDSLIDSYTNQEQILQLQSDSLISISDIIEINGIKYSQLDYSLVYRVDFSSLKKEGGVSPVVTSTIREFKKQFGPENVKFDRKNYYIKVFTANKLYAIYESKKTGWRFIPRTREMQTVYSEIIPQIAIAKF